MSPASARVRGDPHGGALERLADELGVLDGGDADPRDEGPELGHDLHEALVAQADQRLADRRAADRQALGQLVLGDALARRELCRDDRVAQRAVDLAARGPGRAARSRSMRMSVIAAYLHTSALQANRQLIDRRSLDRCCGGGLARDPVLAPARALGVLDQRREVVAQRRRADAERAQQRPRARVVEVGPMPK